MHQNLLIPFRMNLFGKIWYAIKNWWEQPDPEEKELVKALDSLHERIDYLHKEIAAAETWWQFRICQNEILFFKGDFGHVENINLEIEIMEQLLSERIDEMQGLEKN